MNKLRIQLLWIKLFVPDVQPPDVQKGLFVCVLFVCRGSGGHWDGLGSRRSANQHQPSEWRRNGLNGRSVHKPVSALNLAKGTESLD